MYTDKKWVGNKSELAEEEIMIKDKPSIAKVKVPDQTTKELKNLTLTVINNDKSETNTTSNKSLSTSQNVQLDSNTDESHHVGKSVTKSNNAAIQMAIEAAA